MALNPPPLPPPLRTVGPEMVVSPHPDLIRTSQFSKSIQVTSINTHIPPTIMQHEALLGKVRPTVKQLV